MLLISFIAEHNLPFVIAEHMTELCKKMFPDSAIADALHMKRTKCTDLTKKIGSVISENLVKDLKRCKFSIIIDESTDVSATKCLSIIVKYYDAVRGTILTRMLDLVNIYSDNKEMCGSSGQSLFNVVYNSLHNHGIPLSNLVGFAADGASNIMGEHNSLSSRLKQMCPGITIFKCICHSLHLCASEAAKTLPRHCEDLIRNIYTYFAHSAKRKYDFQQFQNLLDLKPHKLLHPCQTRWLSLHQAVERILEQWDALKQYFSHIESTEKLRAVTLIVKDLGDPSVYMYLHFLKFILPTITHLNLLFQKETPTIFHIHFHLHKLYKQTLQYFCHNNALEKLNISTFDPAQDTHHVPLNQIYLGAYIHALLQKPEFNNSGEMIKDVKGRCRGFMIKLCEEMKKRFDISDPIWQMTSHFYPQSFIDPQTRVFMPSLYPLVNILPRIYEGDIQTLDNEWRSIDSITLPSDLNANTHDPIGFYDKLANFKHHNEYLFKTVATFALNILALPVTNTDAERLFSKLHLIKSDIRNKLNLQSVKALCYVSQDVREQGGCYKYKASYSLMDVF